MNGSRMIWHCVEIVVQPITVKRCHRFMSQITTSDEILIVSAAEDRKLCRMSRSWLSWRAAGLYECVLPDAFVANLRCFIMDAEKTDILQIFGIPLTGAVNDNAPLQRVAA